MRRVRQLSEDVRARVCAATGAQGVSRVEPLQRLWSGYGQIARVWLDGGTTSSVVVKWVQPPAAVSEDPRSHARKLRSYAVEQSFYLRHAPRSPPGCRLARALACEQLADQWLFVLEDLDAAGFSERRARLSARDMPVCLEWLAQFHATFLGEAQAARDLWPVGTYWHLATRPDELARSVDPELREAASWLDARLRSARHRTLVHGDAKLENFCFSRDLTRIAAVDFQYVGGGCGVADVAYFIGSCLDADACAAHAPALLDHYFACLQRALLTQQLRAAASEVEAEWRALYPVAWADFCRFLSGWAQEGYARTPYDEHMIGLALAGRPAALV